MRKRCNSNTNLPISQEDRQEHMSQYLWTACTADYTASSPLRVIMSSEVGISFFMEVKNKNCWREENSKYISSKGLSFFFLILLIWEREASTCLFHPHMHSLAGSGSGLPDQGPGTKPAAWCSGCGGCRPTQALCPWARAGSVRRHSRQRWARSAPASRTRALPPAGRREGAPATVI